MEFEPLEPISSVRWAMVVVIVLTAGLSLSLVPDAAPASGSPADISPPMMQVAPGGQVELASLPHDHQRLYEAAAADSEAFGKVACYCGCEAFLDHRHLLDCFVLPDGGWERHATGCAICLAEAREVVAMRDAQVPVTEIVRHIDASYAAVTAESPG